jgi:hypothetical protein
MLDVFEREIMKVTITSAYDSMDVTIGYTIEVNSNVKLVVQQILSKRINGLVKYEEVICDAEVSYLG